MSIFPMKTSRIPEPRILKLIVTTIMLFALLLTGSAMGSRHQSSSASLDAGYSALKLFLEDEQHLTTIRRIKTVLTFKGTSKKTKELIDRIADTSEQALDEMEKLSAAEPAIVFREFDDDSIGKATLDSMRFTTAKEFVFDSEEFEKSMLLSQSQILRVISHLAKQLEQKETNTKRKAWLNKLSARYESYYRQVYALIVVTS